MSAAAPSQTVFSIGYDFHVGNGTSGADNGNVFGITNYKDNTRNQTFAYDALNRLASAQNAGTDCTVNVLGGNKKFWGNTYAYDAWGNLVNKVKIGTACAGENLSVTADAHNWIHATGGSDYLYDAAGNMTFNATPPTQTYTYDQENRLTGAAGYAYTYDGDGNRVRKSNGNLAANGTLYWYMTPGIVGESDLSGNLTDEYVFFDGERVARKSTNGVFYYFSDHLKTASVITDSSGNITSESDFYPWGGELQFVNNDSNHYKFTGKERDSETQLDYFGARYYSNGLGRWVSADWSATPVPVPYADFGDPQSLNLYAYVRNVPTTDLDTDGHASLAWERIKAVRIAWKQEQALVQRTGTGTRDWTAAERAQLIQNGRVSGYEGHHINSVNNNPNMAANPDNVEFVTRQEHLEAHGGNWRNPTTGQFMSRSVAVLQVADIAINAIGDYRMQQLTGIGESFLSQFANFAGAGPGYGTLFILDPAKAAVTLDGESIDVFGAKGRVDVYDVKDGQYFPRGSDQPTDPEKMKGSEFEIHDKKSDG